MFGLAAKLFLAAWHSGKGSGSMDRQKIQLPECHTRPKVWLDWSGHPEVP